MSRPTMGSDSLAPLVPVAAVAMLVALWGALLYAPTERIEGDVQRLFYVHVPAAFTMYLGYGLLFLASAMYMWRRQERWDEVAVAAADIATLFATIVLITGPIWAKPSWGTWWVWDARLTSTLVLWLMLVAYQMLRQYGGVLAIIGGVDLPIIHYSVTWWRTLHPVAKIMTEGSPGAGLEPSMLLAFALGMVATLALSGILVALRLRLERLGRRIARTAELVRGEG